MKKLTDSVHLRVSVRGLSSWERRTRRRQRRSRVVKLVRSPALRICLVLAALGAIVWLVEFQPDWCWWLR